MDRIELELYLNKLLEASRFKDYCPNGLQVEGRRRVSKLATRESSRTSPMSSTLMFTARLNALPARCHSAPCAMA